MEQQKSEVDLDEVDLDEVDTDEVDVDEIDFDEIDIAKLVHQCCEDLGINGASRGFLGDNSSRCPLIEHFTDLSDRRRFRNEVIGACLSAGFDIGPALRRVSDGESEDRLLVAVTECRSREEIDALAAAISSSSGDTAGDEATSTSRSKQSVAAQ